MSQTAPAGPLSFDAGGRPPLAGWAGMVERLTEVVTCLDRLLDPTRSAAGATTERPAASPGYRASRLYPAAPSGRLVTAVGDPSDPDGQPPRTGAQVRREFEADLAQIAKDSAPTPRLHVFSAAMPRSPAATHPVCFTPTMCPVYRAPTTTAKRLRNRTGAAHTTGEKGLTRRILQRTGAWELLPHPSTLAETAAALAHMPRQTCAKNNSGRASWTLQTTRPLG